MIIYPVAAGIPVTVIVSVSSASPSAKLIVAAIFTGMFVLDWLLAAISAVNGVVDNRKEERQGRHRRPPGPARLLTHAAGRPGVMLTGTVRGRPGMSESSKLESHAIEDALAGARLTAVPRLLLGGVYVF